MKTRVLSPAVSSAAKLLALSAALWLQSASMARAIMADPNPIEYTQPDGTKIQVRLQGDEFYHWREDLEGFTVLLQGREYVYAQLDAQNRLTPTGWPVGRVDPHAVGLKPHLLPAREARPPNLNQRLTPYRPWAVNKAAAAGAKISAQGTVKNLVILCKFSDHTLAAHTRSSSDYDILFNHDGKESRVAPTGSVKDAYQENSYGIVNLESTVLAWVTLPQNQAFYTGTNNGLGLDYPNNAQKMVEDALDLADPLVDFGQFDMDKDGFVDAIDIIHSGYGAESTGLGIWSHRFFLSKNWVSGDNNDLGVKVKVSGYHTEPALYGGSGTNITRIGVIVHETGHFFGLPDLYDREGAESAGIGSWCMMANSWGFDNDQLRPPHFSAWCKVFLGWVTPALLSDPGVYTIRQAESDAAVFKITRNYPPNEYLLIENREPVGLDSRIPQGGLAIWHIDETKLDNNHEGFPGQSGWPTNNNHYHIALLQADGHYDLEKNHNNGDSGDLYHSAIARLGPSTVPNSDGYQSGVVAPTQIEISNISGATTEMSFFFGLSRVVFASSFFLGTDSNGSIDRPFKTVHEAYDAAQDGYAICIRGNIYHEAPFTLTKRVTLISYGGPATISQ